MNRGRFQPLFALILLFATACQAALPPAPPVSTLPTDLPAQASPNVNPTGAAAAPYEGISLPETAQTEQPEDTPADPGQPAIPEATLPRTDYMIEATLDYDRHLASVDQTIRYTNRSAEPLPALILIVEPVFYAGTFELKDIGLEGGPRLEELTWEKTRLEVALPEPLEPGEQVALYLSFVLNLPSPERSAETRPVPFGYTARQTNLVDWYPYIPPYQEGQGWLAHDPGYFGEHTVYEQADFEVRFRLAGQRTNLVIAASAAPAQEGEWQVYRLEAARNFALSVSDQYEVLEGEAGGVKVYSYAFPFHRQAGQRVLETTLQALTLYSELFGDYPRDQLSAIEADFLDGMEYEGLYFLSEGFYNLHTGLPADYLSAIAAHETAHQWWYARVANDQALEPWLDEALCTYAERLYYERYYPEGLAWWWAYRVDYYSPRGWVDGSIYNPEGYRSYRDAVYLNGAHFLEDLRTALGDDAFFSFLKSYTQENSGKIATRDDFFRALQEQTGTGLDELLSKYFQKVE